MLKLMSGVEIWVVKVPAAKAIQSLAKPASPSLHHSIISPRSAKSKLKVSGSFAPLATSTANLFFALNRPNLF
jgi:hypothetical protein